MKSRSLLRILMPLGLAIVLVVTWQIGFGSAQHKSETAAADAKSGLSHFLVISPHTTEQCLAALDAVMDLPDGEAELAKWDWGCMAGDHTGYLMVSVATAEDALKHVPKAEAATATVIKLNKFTPDQIRSFHQMKK